MIVGIMVTTSMSRDCRYNGDDEYVIDCRYNGDDKYAT